MKKGIFYGVGVGPGDPELLTIKAVRVLRTSDVIGIPVSGRGDAAEGRNSTAFSIACRAVPELAGKECCRLSFPMTREPEKREAAFRENAARVISRLAEGKNVAFPVLGDPSIYSTYTYVSRLVAAAGYPTEVIPGIPSFSAAAAAADRSLGEDDTQIHVIPVLGPQGGGAASAVTGPQEGGAASVVSSACEALSLPGRKVFMKGGRFSGQLRDLLVSRGIPAVMIENCGMENEKIYRSAEDFPDQAGYYSIILV